MFHQNFTVTEENDLKLHLDHYLQQDRLGEMHK